jgi:hypothetical protein
VTVEEAVKGILSSVQWDVWRFYLSAKQLIKQKIVVISHGHMDHWDRNVSNFDIVLVPPRVSIPRQLVGLKNIVSVYNFCRIGKIRFVPVGTRLLTRLLRQSVFPPHAMWWLCSHRDARVLFVGDLDSDETDVIKSFVSSMFKFDQPLSGVILPSYGLTKTHGVNARFAVSELAEDLRDTYNLKIGALPHPISADWADYNAVRVESLADSL